MSDCSCFKATPHKARLTAWRHIYLRIFRHLAQKFFAGCQPDGIISAQSDCVSVPTALCGIALTLAEWNAEIAQAVAQMPNLVDLCLYRRENAEWNLHLLTRCKQLRHLEFNRIKVSDEQLAVLQAELPNCHIDIRSYKAELKQKQG